MCKHLLRDRIADLEWCASCQVILAGQMQIERHGQIQTLKVGDQRPFLASIPEFFEVHRGKCPFQNLSIDTR